jgi:hypothetical protein
VTIRPRPAPSAIAHSDLAFAAGGARKHQQRHIRGNDDDQCDQEDVGERQSEREIEFRGSTIKFE